MKGLGRLQVVVRAAGSKLSFDFFDQIVASWHFFVQQQPKERKEELPAAPQIFLADFSLLFHQELTSCAIVNLSVQAT